MEFPCLVYKSAESYSVANDDDEHAALIAAGWFSSVPEALVPRVAPVAAPVVIPPAIADIIAAREVMDAQPVPVEDRQIADADDAAPTRAELEQKAAELGVEFSPRIGDTKLAERITDAIASKA